MDSQGQWTTKVNKAMSHHRVTATKISWHLLPPRPATVSSFQIIQDRQRCFMALQDEMHKLSFELVADPDFPIVKKEEDPEGDEDEEDDGLGDDEEYSEEDEHPYEKLIGRMTTVLPLPPPSSLLVSAYRTARVFQIRSDDDHCINIMNDFRHPNILRLESIIRSTERNSEHTLFVQPYIGVLDNYIELTIMDDDNFELEEFLEEMQIIYRQIINGMSYLMDQGLHHSGFTLQKTYYCREHGELLIKLANFRTWTLSEEWGGITTTWKDDWFSVGKSLDEVVALLILHRVQSFTGELKELAKVLKDGTIDPCKMKETALNQTFFWSPEKRAAVFIHNVPRLLSNNNFYKAAAKSFGPPGFVWADNALDGLVRRMNAHRKKTHKSEYGEKDIHYLKLVSGCYTHEHEFKDVYPLTRAVDATFRKFDPGMCVRLMRIMKALEGEKDAELQKGKK